MLRLLRNKFLREPCPHDHAEKLATPPTSCKIACSVSLWRSDLGRLASFRPKPVSLTRDVVGTP
jgi:hypothetical protein